MTTVIKVVILGPYARSTLGGQSLAELLIACVGGNRVVVHLAIRVLCRSNLRELAA